MILFLQKYFYRMSNMEETANVAMRKERDTMGEVDVPKNSLYGAQTARSLFHFNYGLPRDRMPLEVVYGLVQLKMAAAGVNADLGLLERRLANAVQQAARDVLMGAHDEHFPLSIWQTGSGTQSNMNVNEVN